MNIAERLVAARRNIQRVSADDLARRLAERDPPLVLDLRCGESRSATGVIPGSFTVPLSTLEWRCDPTSEWSDPRVAQPHRSVILVCEDGYSSSLAAARIVELGFTLAGDLVGGMAAWAALGLPVADAKGQLQAEPGGAP